jgi:hypothetical protein
MGLFSVSEYLDFYQVVQGVRDKSFQKVQLIGPSVIDFEYYYTAFALFNLPFSELCTLFVSSYLFRNL